MSNVKMSTTELTSRAKQIEIIAKQLEKLKREEEKAEAEKAEAEAEKAEAEKAEAEAEAEKAEAEEVEVEAEEVEAEEVEAEEVKENKVVSFEEAEAMSKKMMEKWQKCMKQHNDKDEEIQKLVNESLVTLKDERYMRLVEAHTALIDLSNLLLQIRDARLANSIKLIKSLQKSEDESEVVHDEDPAPK